MLKKFINAIFEKLQINCLMKIAKYIILLLLLFGVAFTVFIATQPSSFTISKTKNLATSKENIYKYISNYNNWNEWYPDLLNDSTLIATVNNNNTAINWLPSTSISTTKLFVSDSIYQIKKTANTEQQYIWSFNTKKDSVTINWKVKGELSFKEKLMVLLKGGVDEIFGEDLSKGLENIEKSLTEGYSKHEIKINGFATKHGTNYIQIKDSCAIKDFEKIRKKNLLELLNFTKENKIDAKGSSFTIFKDWNEKDNFTSFAICVPIDFEIVTTSNPKIQGGKLEPFLALKTTLNGSLDYRKDAWDQSFDYILKNKYTQNETGTYIEVYKVVNATKPSDLRTEIYIPVRKLVVQQASTLNDSIETPQIVTDTIK